MQFIEYTPPPARIGKESSNHQSSGNMSVFLGESFSPPHPLLSTGQSLKSSWRQTHHGAIPRNVSPRSATQLCESWERDLKTGCSCYFETPMILKILCFLGINPKQKFAKARPDNSQITSVEKDSGQISQNQCGKNRKTS